MGSGGADLPEERSSEEGEMSIFQPPVLRSAAATLNRALFTKTFNLAAARINDVRHIAKYQKALTKSQDLLRLDRVSSVIDDPESSVPGGRVKKCLVLRPGISSSVPETWGEVIRNGIKEEEVEGVIPYDLTLDYDYWTPRDVLASLLPEEFHDDIPTGFNTAGHVAHLNLRERFAPYKQLVAEVLLDKNPQIKTIINKTDMVGTESQFRTFSYEVLAGPDDLNVEVRENNCVYKFDYSKVYWNSKLEKEHTRLVNLFKPGEVVCDVMAGIGPFAVPAGKKGVFVWANDMNPESYHYLKDSIERNKASNYVRAFNEDGMTFIQKAADSVLAAAANGEYVEISPKPAARRKAAAATHQRPPAPPTRIPIPATISHFVMNLPASAIEFLPRYRGLYAGREALFAPNTEARLPLVHVHCFAVKRDDDVPKLDVCERVSEQLGVAMALGDDPEREREVAVHHVRAVAPKKSMFCATFRLPAEVAFAPR